MILLCTFGLRILSLVNQVYWIYTRGKWFSFSILEACIICFVHLLVKLNLLNFSEVKVIKICNKRRFFSFYSVLFCSILLCSVLLCYVLFYSVLFCSVLFYSALFCSILFYSVLFCSIASNFAHTLHFFLLIYVSFCSFLSVTYLLLSKILLLIKSILMWQLLQKFRAKYAQGKLLKNFSKIYTKFHFWSDTNSYRQLW